MNNNIDIIVWRERIGRAMINERIDWDKHTLEPIYTTDEKGNTQEIAFTIVERKEQDTIDILNVN